MSLTERIKDRRTDEVAPIKERRVPEWRRRALAQLEEKGFIAVTDLTQTRSAA